LLFIVLSVIAGQFLLPSHLLAQAGSSDILGTVTDSSGAVVVGAKVTVKDLNTSATRVATTDANGGYTFNTLPNSQYSLKVEMQGFKAYNVAGFALNAGVRLRQDAKLATGSVTETVEVTSVAAVMQTDTSEVASTVAESVVQDLPLNERNFAAALQIQPGMSQGITSGATSFSAGQSPEDRRPSFVVVANGQDDALNNQLIDGFDNNERNLGLAGVRPSIDGIAEVKMDTSSYSAEYGRAAGAVINVITKSGGNDFKGSLYEYFRNDVLDAKFYNFQPTPLPKGKLRNNSYGGSFGGPVLIPKVYNGKNKTFFFVDWEQDRKVAGLSPTQLTVPTLFEINTMAAGGGLDLSDVIDGNTGLSCGSDSHSGAVCPSDGAGGFVHSDMNFVPDADIDPVARNYFLMLPAPTDGVNKYTNIPVETQTSTNFDVRIDQHMGSNDVLFGRFAYNPVDTIYPETIPQITEANATAAQKAAGLIGIYPGGSGGAGFPGPSKSTSYNSQFDYVHIFSPSLLLDLKAGFTRVNINSLPYNYNNGSAAQVGFDASVDTGGGLPAMGAWGPLEGSANSVPLVDINNTFQYAGSVTYTRGSHNIKAGGGLIRRQINAYQQALNGGFIMFGNSQANGGQGWDQSPWWDGRQNFITGTPDMMMRTNQIYKPGFRTWEISGYLQDDWRLGRKLTVNMGLRYDVYTPISEAHGRYANFDMNCISSVTNTNGDSCFVLGTKDKNVGIKTDYKDVSPRLGFAYSVNSTTVVRGGFGMSFFPPDVGEQSSGGGPPSSIIQNYNPPYTFNYAGQMPYNDAQGNPCTVTNAPGGTSGCLATRGAPAPALYSLTDFIDNRQITTVSAKPTNIKSAYVMMQNLAVQKQFGAKNSVTIAYVGEMGRQLIRTVNADQPLPGSNTHGWIYSEMPNINTINYYYNAASSSYNALQTSYSRSLSKGLTINGNYTWSHNISDAANLLTNSLYVGDAKTDNGNAFTDLRHRFAITASYELPFGANSKGLEAALIKGWKLNEIGYWQTGSPFTVGNNLPNVDAFGIRSGRADQVGNPNTGKKTLNEWFNADAFVQTTEHGRQGNEMVNQVFGPHQRNVDLSLNKDFEIMEKLKAQFRAECFNISNTPNFGTPGASPYGRGNTDNPDYNKITSVMYGSNPRQFQFALKLLF